MFGMIPFFFSLKIIFLLELWLTLPTLAKCLALSKLGYNW
uniref:Uncharacterized protein n=1 Tax=Arundo donax TaxID=35708 RepID=A0A0A9GQH0_ARUDO